MPYARTSRFIIVLILLCSIQICVGQSASYKIRYAASSRYFYFKDQAPTKDQGMVLVGKSGPIEDSADVTVMKLDEYGSVVWSKVYPSIGRIENLEITEMSDGSIAIASDLAYATATSYFSDAFVMKLNCRGEQLWSNRIALNTPADRKALQPTGIREGKAGDLIVSFSVSQRGGVMAAVCRFGNAGNLVWSKTFTGTNNDCSYIPEAFYRNNKIFVTGLEKYSGNFITPTKRLFGMVLNYDNGATEKEQAYNLAEFTAGQTVLFTHPKLHFDAEQLTDNTLALFGVFAGSNAQTFYYYKLIVNEDLSIKQSQAYSTSPRIGIKRSKITVFPNGQTHITGPEYESATYYWYGADKANNPLVQKKTPYTGSTLFNGDRVFQRGPGHYGYFVSNYTDNRYQVDIAQVRNGDNNITPCMGIDTSFITPLPWQVAPTSWNWASVADNLVINTPFPLPAGDLPITTTDLCAPVRPAKIFAITGNANICTGLSTAFTYQVKTGKNEYKPVQWRMASTAYQSFNSINDSTVSIVFKNPTSGPYRVMLYANGGNCQPVADSFEINVYPASRLPRYANICTQSVQADPGHWFKAYRWQDGSTNPVYTITQPGRYIVQLTTQCNEVITDTIDSFSDKTGLLQHESICKNDTLELRAPAGFINYSWGPDYNLDRLSDEVVQVYPEKDTFYLLSSETTDGCQLKDTVYVHVKSKPLVSLGNDTTVCIESDLTLKAGNGFISYLWSTGAVSPIIKITNPGDYSVTVTDAGGCAASDTIAITGKICPRRMRIPNAFSPNNDGANDVFKPFVQGRLEFYEMIVYNRWGAIAFRTTNPLTGWNGTIGGSQQNSGTYVWVCRYKFLNESARAEKGALMLIR